MSDLTVDAWVYAKGEDTPTGRALAIHYPATNGDGPDVCAVCYWWGGPRYREVSPEPWPCPTVRALMPKQAKASEVADAQPGSGAV